LDNDLHGLEDEIARIRPNTDDDVTYNDQQEGDVRDEIEVCDRIGKNMRYWTYK
jgi:hypothetical protein